LSDLDKKLCVINVPLTYPPPPVNGILISGMLTPGTDCDFTYPASVAEELKKLVGGEYVLDVWWQHYGEKVEPFLETLLSCTRQRVKACLHFFEEYDWDFFMSVFIGTDRIQHYLWNYIEHYILGNGATNPLRNGERIRDLIVQYYQEIDRYVGRILDSMGDDGTLIIMSDHGFGEMKGKFNINNWLMEQGLLSYHTKRLRMLRLRAKLAPLRPALKRLDFLNLRRFLMNKVNAKSGRQRGFDFVQCVDWAKTKAYSVSSTEQGIYINVRGRDFHGNVEPGQEYEELRTSIIKSLQDLKDPATGEPLVSEVYRREQVYEGAYADRAPDIIFFLKGGEYIASVQPTSPLIEKASLRIGTGTHRLEGVFLSVGRDIRPNLPVESIRIIDLAPTILHLMGLPVPDDMDGAVAKEILAEGFLEENPIMRIHANDGDGARQGGDEREYSQEEERALADRLRGLGYME
jgi:predicted AlkP superfamily phosphohydrolase/phosphomutase